MKKIYVYLALVSSLCATNELMAQLPPLNASVTQQPCNANGVISVTATGLSGPVSYTYSNYQANVQVVHSNMPGNTDQLTNVSAYYSQFGNPNVWYITASNGTSSLADSVLIAMPFNFTLTITPGNCPSPSTIQAGGFSGGAGPYSFTYTNLQSSLTYTGNPAFVSGGPYSLIATNGAGCMVSATSQSAGIYVNQVPSFTVNASGTSANCNNGTASVAVLGGVAPFTYSWNTNDSSSNISGLSTGNYNCLVTDATGCSVMAYQYVPQAVVLNYNSTISNATCVQNNGTVTSFVTGGTAPYSFIWNNFATTQNLNNVPAGTYIAQITDANGCTGSAYIYVGSTTPINVTYSITPSSCTSATGGATLSITGGSAPYSVTWNTFPSPATGIAVSALPAGNYAFQVTDANGCIRTGNVIIPTSSSIIASITSPTVVCPLNSANVALTVSGSNAPFTYLWNNAATTSAITASVGAAYTCTITDAVGCTLVKYGSVYQTSGITVGLNTTPTNCQFAQNGAIAAVVSGGTAPYTYNWSNNQTTASISGLGVGYYNVTVTSANGCSKSAYTYLQSNNTSTSCYCVVTGTVYQDANLNCAQNAGELGIANVAVHCSGYGYAYTNANGVYQFLVPSGNYTITEIAPQYYPLANCQAASQTISASAASNCTITANFANNIIPTSDLRMVTSNLNFPVPGNTYNQRIIVHNDGSMLENNVKLGYKHDGQLNYSSCAPIALTQPNSTSYPDWYRINTGFPSLSPSTSYQLNLNYNVPTNIPMFTQVSFNDTIAKNNPIGTNWLLDQTPWNNVNAINTTVLSSYDPNFKEVSPQGEGADGFIQSKDSILTYVVHFQNTGSYFAYNIVVVDTLDSDLRISSFKPGYSDRRCKVETSDNGVVKYTFAGINLPWKDAYGDALSSGMFTYSVRLKKNLPMGTKIKNRAYIYFDYNAPIITNTTLNTLRAASGVGIGEDFAEKGQQSAIIYPNPATDLFNLRFDSKNTGDAKLALYDISGRELSSTLLSLKAGTNTLTHSTAELNSGIYFVVLTTDEFSIEKKLIVTK